MARVDDGFAVALHDGSIVVCNTKGDEVATHTSTSHPTQCLGSAKDRLFCASYGRVEIRNLPSGAIVDTISIRQAKLEAIAVSPDATQLAVAGESVHVWDLDKRRVILETAPEYWKPQRRCELQGTAAIISPSESQILTRSNSSLYCHDARSGELVWQRVFEEPISTMRYSRSGEEIAVAFDTDIQRVSAETAQIVQPNPLVHENSILTMDYSTDDLLLAVGHENNGVTIWRLGDICRIEFELPLETWPTAVLFNDVLLAGTLEGDLLLYSSDSFHLLDRRQVHQWRIHRLSLSADGRSCLTSSYDGTSVIVPLP